MAANGRHAKEILLQVCIECGTEYIIEDGEPAREEACGKCGNVVYRSFHAATGSDDVGEDFRETTERDTATDAGPSEVTAGDLRDLERL